MQDRIRLEYNNLLSELNEEDIFGFQPEIDRCHTMLHEGSGAGSDFLGWLNLAGIIEETEVTRIESLAKELGEQIDCLLVIGIGGSYLGARAVLEGLNSSFYNMLPQKQRKGPQILFAGHHLDPAYHHDLLDYLEDKKFAINVISKSGTTTEPALAFRLFRSLLEKKVGRKKASESIIATTDKSRGALRQLAEAEGYQTFVIPDDVGGRYSVLTPVGLVPIAFGGVDIRALILGARAMEEIAATPEINRNPCSFYAAARNALYRKGKKIEILANFVPSLHYFGEWWKQLYGESEGKEGRGIFPAACDFSTDLHSMGQYIQQGERKLFETFLHVGKSPQSVIIEGDPDNLDGLNYLTGRGMDYVNAQALAGTAIAHREGGTPSMTLKLPELNAYHLGQMIYFFEKACGLSGYLLGVNPFDQPGVEAYKKNMFALLSKPGFEQERKELIQKLPELGQEKSV